MKRQPIIITCAIALAVALMLGCLVFSAGRQHTVPDPPNPTPSVTDEVTVHVLNVGEGLSVLIDDGEVEVLIDGGYKQYGDDVSEYIGRYVDGAIEYVIATHSDSDHVGGLIQVYADYQVACTIYGNESNTNRYKEFKQAALSEPDSEYRNDTNETFELSEGVILQTIDVIDDDTAANNNSIIALLDTGASRLLVTGDAEEKAERLLSGKIGRVGVYIVGHHGSETSSSQAFLDEIRPTYGIISSAGPSYQYHNPDGEVMKRLSTGGTKLYATYRSDNIIVTFSGSSISLSPPTAEQITPENYRDAA
jgi:beta-lactamase superfamily II metal-dependent hydrolase